jgi:hypothetical protein
VPAPGGWFHCEVVKTGPADDGNVYACFTEKGGAFGPRWFRAYEPIKTEMLTTALSAISTGNSVSVALESSDEYSRIMRMYLVKAGY